MDPNQPDGPRGFGRGRPAENCDLRRPFVYTYANDAHIYVPVEGRSNVLELNNAVSGIAAQPVRLSGDPGVCRTPVTTHASQPSVINSSGDNKIMSETKSVLSPYAPEFVPRNFRPEPRTNPSQVSINTDVDTSSDSYPIQKLRQFLFEITLNPGKFESKIEQLIDCFNDYICNDEAMRAAVNIIFDESIMQPNFRYSGARLARHLVKEVSYPSECSGFLRLLLVRCSQEHKRRVDLLNGEDDGAYLRGFAMFLAELFSQVESNGQRIRMFSDLLIAVVETILSKPTTDNLKCICQILKLVGAYLEDLERKIYSSAPQMDNIMRSLNAVANNQEFPKDIRAMVSNVVNLRSSDWGRACEEEHVVQELPPPSSVNEPVMYGPDGKPITDEESLFLHSQYSNSASDGEEYDLYEDGVCDEMGDEMQAAFEVYLSERPH